MSLMSEMASKALRAGIPLSVHLDLTYRCNERCVHCYLDHDDHGEMNIVEIRDLLTQMAEAGVFFLTLSGGEIFLRKDFFEILEHARSLMFSVKLKTNAVIALAFPLIVLAVPILDTGFVVAKRKEELAGAVGRPDSNGSQRSQPQFVAQVVAQRGGNVAHQVKGFGALFP